MSNIYSDFDFSLLDDPEFKEDSVREELIVPLLKALGYNASGPNKITRSKPLTHPYVHIGTKKHKVNIIPDYLLRVGDEHNWILDAKAPGEDILKGKNPEQAFSYAIHPEVRAFRYALCNGRQISIFDVSKVKPLLVLSLEDITEKFKEVERLLNPLAFTKPYIFDFKPDFGLFMLKSGAHIEQTQHFMPIGIPLLAKVEDGLYTVFVSMLHGDIWLGISFDFDEVRFEQLMQAFPDDKEKEAREALKRQPYKIIFKDNTPEVCVDAKFGETVHSNENEDYLPLLVDRFYVL